MTSNGGRMALNSLTDSDLNINRNTPTKISKIQRAASFLQSTPIKPRMNKRPFVMLELNDSNHLNIRGDPYDISDDVSPRLKRARIIKMKLQIAWYKVKTNQTTTPLTQLKFPITKKKPKIQPRVLSPGLKKSMLELTASKVYKLPSATAPSFDSSPTLDALQGGKMDDIVFKRSLKYKNDLNIPIPLSAPASTTSFTHNQNIFSSINSISSNKYSLELKANSATTERFKLPPISKLLQRSGTEINNTIDHSIVDSKNESTSPVITTGSQRDTTIDRDVTIEQVTPVRVTRDISKKLPDKSLCDDEITQTQIWSSPIQTTPSSIGAARCLLQLAHR